MSKKASSVLDLMCDSPLVELKGRQVTPPRAHLWAKLELFLPGAMKDRVALKCIEDAERDGRLQPGGVIAESSSGTMALGLARVGAIKGYRVIIVTDPRIDPLMLRLLRALGAEVEVVERYHPEGGWQHSRLLRLKEVLEENPGAFWTRQYDTPSNPGAYEAMARELVEALGTDIAALVGTVGSGGSLTGTARFLRRQVPDLEVVAVDAVGSVLFHQPVRQRLQSGHGNNIVPGNIDYSQIDEAHWIADGEAFSGCHELAAREGIFAGGSSGAVYIAASWVARRHATGRHVVAILPDGGERYHELIFSHEELSKHGLSGQHAAAEPDRIRYGMDVAQRWSCARVPQDGSSYFAPEVSRTIGRAHV